MKALSILLILFISNLASAQPGWQVLDIPFAVRYDDVFFVTDSIGWTVGSYPGRIYKTTNQGATWTLQLVNNDQYMRSVEFFDSLTGFAGTLDSAFYKTTDGGQTWTNIMDSITPRVPGICGLSIPDSNTVYGCGVWTTPAYIIKSTDKGNHWQYINMSAYASKLVDIQFLSADTGFATGASINPAEGGVVLYTTDGGSTWQYKHKTNVIGDHIWKIQALDTKHFYASIQADSFFRDTRILRSNDGGMNWDSIIVDTNYQYLQMVGFIDTLHGWTGGNGVLFSTNDGGLTWDSTYTGSAYDRFFRLSPTLAFLTGSRVYKLVDSTAGIISEPYDPVHSLSVNPNPAKSMVTVDLTLGNRTFADLTVYNSAGQFVQQVLHQHKDAGKYQFAIKLEPGPSQTYYIILHTNEGVISKKVIMTR